MKGTAISVLQPFCEHLRTAEPDAVPVGIVAPAVLGGLHVALRACGVGVESVPGAVIEEGVEREQEGVALKVREVAPQRVDDEPVRLAVVQHRADVQHVVVVQEAHFGALAGGAELVGKLLVEIARRLGQRPGRLVEAPSTTIGSVMRTAATRLVARTAWRSKSCAEAAAVGARPRAQIRHRTRVACRSMGPSGLGELGFDAPWQGADHSLI